MARAAGLPATYVGAKFRAAAREQEVSFSLHFFGLRRACGEAADAAACLDRGGCSAEHHPALFGLHVRALNVEARELGATPASQLS